MENTKRCQTCGFDAKQEAKFCPRCGGNQFVEPAVRCPVCGADVPKSKYCAHCGADLENPAAQVWHSCQQCATPVHITYTNCPGCGAAVVSPVPPVQPRRRKKTSFGRFLLLLIPVLILVAGIGIGVAAYLENGWPELLLPTTTASAQVPNTTSLPAGPIGGNTTLPEKTDPTTKPTQGPTTQPTVAPTTQPTVAPTTQPTVAPTTKPTQPPTEPTQPPTEPTQPTEPAQPSVVIPSIFADNHYLSAMHDGYCETMTGEMLVVFLLVSDPTDGWTETEAAEAEAAMKDELRILLNEAAGYGAELNIRVAFLNVTIQSEYARGEDGWKEEAMTQAGLKAGYDNQETMERDYEADQVPVVFVVDEPGRSYATSYTSGSGFESVVILQKDYTALRHELCHLFGARDLYFPKEAKEAGKQYLPGSIMNDSTGAVDPLTAFVIGWTDALTDEAVSFLWATNGLTEEYIDAAKELDSLTGYGTKEFDNGTYTGNMVGGVPHGEGTLTGNDGSVYTGNWENGSRTGYGVYQSTDGYRYEGYWLDGKQHGTGTATFANGSSYSGNWSESQFHGVGTYTWADGISYTGDWVNGVREGYGQITTPEGFSYQGDWKNDQYHGTGTAVYVGGDVYTGDWSEGYRHGTGTYTWTDGTCYTGDFVTGKRTGKGTMTWSDGSYYTGDWLDGLFHGYGERYYASYGTRYIGDFVNGKRHGYGTYYYADGTTYTGKWENDAIAD